MVLPGLRLRGRRLLVAGVLLVHLRLAAVVRLLEATARRAHLPEAGVLLVHLPEVTAHRAHLPAMAHPVVAMARPAARRRLGVALRHRRINPGHRHPVVAGLVSTRPRRSPLLGRR